MPRAFIKSTGQFVNLIEEEVALLWSGRFTRPAVAFAVPCEEIMVKDMVRGEVKFPAGEIKDFVIVRKKKAEVQNGFRRL